MRLFRYIREDMVDLAFDPLAEPPPDPWADRSDYDVDPLAAEGPPTTKQLMAIKEKVLEGLVFLLEKSEKIANPKKLLADLRNREAKATTGLGRGIAMPHVRTNQARSFAMAVAVAAEPGIDFMAIDEEPVRLFVAMVAPGHDDKFYLKVERTLAAAFAEGDELRDALIGAETPGEVLRLLSELID